MSSKKKDKEKKANKNKTAAATKKRTRSAKKAAAAKLPKEAVMPLNRNRIAFGFAVILLLMFALMFRLGYWQIVRADELRLMATDMQKVDTEIPPARGSIYDSRMNVLAESVTEYELYAYSQSLYKSSEIPDNIKKSNITILGEIVGKDEEELKKILLGEENLVMVADGLTKEQIDTARKVFDSNVVVRTNTARYYPNGAFAAQLLGGVDINNIGRAGLEYQYNSE